MASPTEKRYEFGKNWERFLKNFSEERLERSRQRLLDALHLPSLQGMTFLDIGSGSGLHSLAAWSAGADRVFSFDYDPHSVSATASLRAHAGNPENWTVQQGSVLDKDFMQALGKFDIVYSWGVLHHTGDTWQAIRNARIPLADNGTFFIALYSDTAYRNATFTGNPSPEEWMRIKQSYNNASLFRKKLMEWRELWRTFFRGALPSPTRFARAAAVFLSQCRQFSQRRGMSLTTDIRDWLGGWPMDFIKEQECLQFCKQELGLDALILNTGEGNTEFIFRPQNACSHWDSVLQNRRAYPLAGPFEHCEGHMWRASIPHLEDEADSPEKQKKSSLVLTENGELFGFNSGYFASAYHQAIAVLGEGLYSHWKDALYFSTSDNSDPNTNGRTYALVKE